MLDPTLKPKETAHVLFALLNGLSLLQVMAPGTKRNRAQKKAQAMEAVRAFLDGLRGDAHV